MVREVGTRDLIFVCKTRVQRFRSGVNMMSILARRKFTLGVILFCGLLSIDGTLNAQPTIAEIGTLLDQKLTPLTNTINSANADIAALKARMDNFERYQGAMAAGTISAAAAASNGLLPTRAATPANKVHILNFSFSGDLGTAANPGIGTGAEANRQFVDNFGQKIKNFFTIPAPPPLLAFDPNRVNIIPTTGRFTVNDFAAGVNAIAGNVSDQDTVFCIISTHGGTDPNTNQHFLLTSDGQFVFRSAIYARLNALNPRPRQLILFTDSCGTVATAPGSTVSVIAGAATPDLPYPLYDLLFNFQGDANINACSKGQESWYKLNAPGLLVSDLGGLGTRSFLRAGVEGAPGDSRGSSNNVVKDWESLFSEFQRRTHAEFVDLKNRNPTIVTNVDQVPGIYNPAGIQVR